jgi:hypothetical protein
MLQGTVMRPRTIRQTSLLAVVAAGLAVGCGGTRPYPVSGQVVYDDGQVASDLAGSDVVFTSDELKVSSSGEIDGNGRYALTMKRKGDGALPGKYKVVIVPPDPGGGDDPNRKVRTLPFPKKYTSPTKTDLSATVEAKANDITLTVDRSEPGRR